MRKQKFTRYLCLIMALLCLVGTATVSVAANTGVTDKSIEDYADQLNTDSYDKYKKETYKAYFDDYANTPAIAGAPFDATKNVRFERDLGSTLEVIEINGLESWKMTVYERVISKDETGKDVISYTPIEGKTYNTVDEAVTAGYSKTDLAYVDVIDQVTSLYTPSDGSVCWTLDLGVGVNGLYNIGLNYYPIYIEGLSKSAAVEREFYINGKAPFSEARALTLQKTWSSRMPDGTSVLIATYVLGKKDVLATVEADAAAAGYVKAGSEADNNSYGLCKYTVAEDGKSVTFTRPVTYTQALYEFIEKYNLRFMITDADQNELRPTMVQTPEWTIFTLRDSGGAYPNPFGFVIVADENGQVQFRLDGVNEALVLSQIILTPYSEQRSYADYLAMLQNNNVDINKQGTGTVKLEAENTSHTSTNGVYPIEDRSSALTSPADTTRVMLNTIGTEKWSTAGQWAEYQFSVNGSGMYEVYSRFKQSYLDGMYVSRALSIYTVDPSTGRVLRNVDEYKAVYKDASVAGYYNGIPFAEAGELRYNYGTNWQITRLTNGVDNNKDGVPDTYCSLYFENGVTYILRFEVTLGTMSTQVENIQKILDALNADYLAIIKLTGTSPDDYRDYNFARLLPKVLLDMRDRARDLEAVSDYLKTTAGVASTYSGTCDKLSNLIFKLVKDEEELAKNLDNFKSYVGNLGTFLSDAKTQPLQLDYLVIQPAAAEAPKAEANFFQSFWHELKCFIQSFFRDYNNMGAMDDGTTTASIDVWLAYGRDQSQVIRNLTTNEFTPETGIAVNLKLVTGSTLLPSILAGMGPDVYLGLADATVINYAIRGALNNIEQMEGFDEVVDECFTRAAMLQLEIADVDGVVHTYGLPETQTFQMMFIRLDILDGLGIEIPKTWEDIYTAQSILESNNMEIGLSTNYKVFLYQSDGELYADDGMRINLDSVKGLAAFEKMCNLFTQHSFPYSYNAANRFRTGEMPIILSDYTALYNQLKVFATEIDGRWTFVPVPGTIVKDENGETVYDENGDPMINNTADSTINAVVMIGGIEDVGSAWTFMKWYTGADCQTDYANEMVAIIGDSAKHPTANRVALQSMPWTRSEYAEVSKQFENLAAIPNYPGSYYLDRHTNFAFLAAYNSDADPKTEILSYINTINKEITRKREEFNLETLEIGQTLAEKRMNQAMTAIDVLKEMGLESKYKDAIDAADLAVKNQKVSQLDDASAEFAKHLEYNYIEALRVIEADTTLGISARASAIQTVIDQTKGYSFYKNVGKQTSQVDDYNYNISSKDMTEAQLVYFITECLRNAADALASY